MWTVHSASDLSLHGFLLCLSVRILRVIYGIWCSCDMNLSKYEDVGPNGYSETDIKNKVNIVYNLTQYCVQSNT